MKTKFGLTLLATAALLATSPASANECKAFGARNLSDTWNWHTPRETPDVRNGNRELRCTNGNRGWLYTRDDIPGQYFVANTNWVQKTRVWDSPCIAVAQYCSNDD